MANLCNLYKMRKSCRGGRSRHGNKITPHGQAQEEAVRKGLVICNLKARVRVELTRVVPFPAGTLLPSPSRNRSPCQKGGYTLLTKRSRQCPLWLGLMVVVYGEPRSAPILNTSPRSGVGQSWFAPSLPIGDGYLQMPSWTVLSTIPTVGQGEAVSRYSVGLADRSGLSLRLSPFDTNIIPHSRAKVKGFWAEILHKVLAIFGAENVQLDEAHINRRAAALRATAKRKKRGAFAPSISLLPEYKPHRQRFHISQCRGCLLKS